MKSRLIALLILFVSSLYAADPATTPPYWPSQNYPYQSWEQSLDAFGGALERAEARDPFKYTIDYGYYTNGYPYLTYLRYTGAKNNLANIFNRVVSAPLYMKWYFDYPTSPDTPRQTYHGHKIVVAANGKSYWIPDYYNVEDWQTQAGCQIDWLKPRNSVIPIDGGVADTPRMGLSYATNGLRNMQAVSNLNYCFVEDKVTLMERGIAEQYNASQSTQEYHKITSPTINSNISNNAESFPYFGVFKNDYYDTIMSSQDLPPGIGEPTWWMDYSDFVTFRTTVPNYDGHAKDSADMTVVTNTPAFLINRQKLIIQPEIYSWGIVSEPTDTNYINQPIQIYVGTLVGLDNKLYISEAFQLPIYPKDLGDKCYKKYKLKWNEIPYCSGYYVVITALNMPPTEAVVMAYQIVAGAQNTTTEITVPDVPVTAPTIFTKSANTNFPLYWFPMGITNLTEFDEPDTHLFDAVNYKNDYSNGEIAVLTTPPAGWWLERQGTPDFWYSEAGVLASNQWYCTFSQAMKYQEYLRILEPHSLKFKPMSILQSLSKIEPSVNWWSLVQPEYTNDITEPGIVAFMTETATGDEWIEFWREFTDPERYFKALPSELGPWGPVQLQSGWGWVKESIKDVCYYDPFKEITNTVGYISNNILVTAIQSTDGTEIDTSTVTNWTLIPGSVATTNIIQPDTYIPVTCSSEPDGDWPFDGMVRIWVYTLVDYVDNGVNKTGRSSAFYYSDRLDVGQYDFVRISWPAVTGASRYAVTVQKHVEPFGPNPPNNPDFRYYDEITANNIDIYYADNNDQNMPYYSENIVSNHPYVISNSVVDELTLTNTLYTLRADEVPVVNIFYQQEEITYCDGDTTVTEPAPRVQTWFEPYWTNQVLAEGHTVSGVTTTETVESNGFITWTNTRIDRVVKGVSGKWRQSRWIPYDLGNLLNLAGVKQESTPYIYAIPEKYDLIRWYQDYVYSNDSPVTAVTTGSAYDLDAQWKYTLKYDDIWYTNIQDNIVSPILPYQVHDYMDKWKYKTPTRNGEYFIK